MKKKASKNAENKKWMSEKKRRKMRNEMNETLIFYLIKKSTFSSFFHFVIFVLTFMFSLNELMLRTFFIVMYKILMFWIWSIFCKSFIEQSDSTKQLSKFNYFFTIFKTRRETTSSSKKRKKSSSIVLMMSRCMKNIFLVEFDIQQKRFEFSFF